MIEFKKEIINGSFIKINKPSKNNDCINVKIRSNDKNVNIKCTGKGIWAAGIIVAVPTVACVLCATASVYLVAQMISKKKKDKEEDQSLIK
ncbi:hypothetical protein [Clostridium chromiireducens]|uniref:Uncharacterized protein n=1 Tax=Clostridium chromiireducens TaxID=225345 RepID=A0A1V4I3K5_9CLOT|nr:hypothetical protein [Clostridium chromiireducens]MVX64718.1 hypothetical protein [Clostridium chromiireducens]OPJ54556.1 hypothetical protein CLCHR_48510 [Clostridium chromiireducens]RII36381.1 hypothetical protein D2A34_03075 [Clostridium chromiireducens]